MCPVSGLTGAIQGAVVRGCGQARVAPRLLAPGGPSAAAARRCGPRARPDSSVTGIGCPLQRTRRGQAVAKLACHGLTSTDVARAAGSWRASCRELTPAPHAASPALRVVPNSQQSWDFKWPGEAAACKRSGANY